MRKIVLFILFIPYAFQGQNSGRIEYLSITNFGITYQTKGVLEFNNKSSKYTLLKPEESSDENKTSIEDNQIIINIKESENRPINFIDKSSSLLLSYVQMFKKNNLIKEEIPKIDWQIVDEFKSLNTIKCQKATGYFRGRIYTVWFTNEIPISFGPWKLQGLPGLILEVQDNKNQIFIQATKISLNDTLDIQIPNPLEAITLKDFITNHIPKKLEEIESYLNAKADRDTTFKMGSINRNTQEEIIYEWEEKMSD